MEFVKAASTKDIGPGKWVTRVTRFRYMCHGSIFDVKTGSVVKGPAREPEPSYQVRMEGNQIPVNV